MTAALVATTKYLLHVDLDSKQVTPLDTARPEYYGISWFPGDDQLVLSHSGINNATLTDIAAYAQSEQGWISAGQRTSRRVLSQPHQILCAPDGRVICANTGRNVITVLDLARPGLFQEAGISDQRWDRLELDGACGDHLNSVFLKDGILYVIAHAYDRGSKLATFSYPGMELLGIETLGARTGLHNIWVSDEGQRISCHSEAGALIDLDARQPLWNSGSAIYTRGLAVSPDSVLVGESQKSGRESRATSLSALWILDRRSWQTLDYFVLGPYGAVNEVRLLDQPDAAHHGHAFAGLAGLLQRRAYDALTSSRLDAARAAIHETRLWRDFDLLAGSAESRADGSKRAASDTLCLALHRGRAACTAIAVHYQFEGADFAHVSAVFAYAGGGSDASMGAFLIQYRAQTAFVSLWHNNALAWREIPTHARLPCASAGVIDCSVSADSALLRIDGEELMRVSAAELGLARCDAGLGMRWQGAAVRPLAPDDAQLLGEANQPLQVPA